MLKRYFRLPEQGSTLRTEMLAGTTTFLTMAYIIVVQPAVLSGSLPGLSPTGLDAGAVMTATCLAAALATALMGLLARLPIAQAPGMGTNFLFAATLVPAAQAMIDRAVAQGTLDAGATSGWQVALGVVFIAGILFLLLSLCGIRQTLLQAISPNMWNGIAVGIGLFIALIGLQGATLVVADPGTLVRMNPQIASPDILLFFFGLIVTAGLYSRGVRGSIIWGMLLTALAATALRGAVDLLPPTIAQSDILQQSHLMQRFMVTTRVVSLPPSLGPTLLRFDLVRALWGPMIPFIFMFLYLDVFDTLGTLAGVLQHMGLVQDNKIPNAKRAFLSDAVGTVAGAALGTSTVTSYIESAAGVEQGGRTGLSSLVVAILFLLALFFSPIVAMVGSYSVITAPALVLVGSMMMQSIRRIEWDKPAEALPAFLTFAGIPFTFSIANGMALGFISYPCVKFLAGQRRDVRWLSWVLAFVLAIYLIRMS